MTTSWQRWAAWGLVCGALGCGDDGASADTGTSSTGEAESSSSSSSTGDDTTGSSSTGDASSSSSTGTIEYPPAMGWGDCSSIPAEFACLPEELCGEYGAGDICMWSGCADSFDCPEQPRTGTAPVVCGEVSASLPGLECYLLCSGMQTCPDGMTCSGDACVWP